jgi:hypothetical protein
MVRPYGSRTGVVELWFAGTDEQDNCVGRLQERADAPGRHSGIQRSPIDELQAIRLMAVFRRHSVSGLCGLYGRIPGAQDVRVNFG